MKITEAKLREIIKQQLNEMVDPTTRAAQANYALFATGDEWGDQIIIYDPSVFVDFLKSNKKLYLIDDIEKLFLQSIQACVDMFSSTGTNNLSKVIRSSVSKEGSKMGPAAYDCAMWIGQEEEYKHVDKTPEGFAEEPPGGLTPDRGSVSPYAEKVWNTYSTRSDVDSFKLDNMREPETENTWDDSYIHPNRRSINSTYVLKREPAGYKQLLKNHRSFLNFLRSQKSEIASKIDKNFHLYMNSSSQNLFYMRYEEEEK